MQGGGYETPYAGYGNSYVTNPQTNYSTPNNYSSSPGGQSVGYPNQNTGYYNISGPNISSNLPVQNIPQGMLGASYPQGTVYPQLFPNHQGFIPNFERK